MGELTGEDLAFALALIEIHPSRAIIVDCGIRSVHVQPVPFHEADQRRFLVKRTDGSIRDFSWRNSLSPKSAASKLAGILRYMISHQVRAFKESAFTGYCESCRSPISWCEVDHIPPVTFDCLMKGWFQSVHLSADDIAIVRRKEYEQHSYLEDEALAQSWVEYHEINARLRCLCRGCHKSTLRTSSKG